MSEAVKTSQRRVITTTATDMATSEPTWLAASILVIRVPPNGLTLQVFKPRLWVRSETWVEIHCVRTGTKIWISRSSVSSQLPSDSGWNSVSRCLTRLTLPFGQFQFRAWSLQTSVRSRIQPTFLDSYSSDSSFTFERCEEQRRH